MGTCRGYGKNSQTCESAKYTWGFLNPFFTKKIVENIDLSNRDPLSVALKLGQINKLQEDLRLGIKTIRGVVLRVVVEAEGTNYVHLQHGDPEPTPLTAYKIYVPELSAHTPPPCNFSRARSEDSSEEWAIDEQRIDKFPTFISADEDTRIAAVGDIVNVTFNDLTNFEHPIYLGPVYGVTFGREYTEGSAKNATNLPCVLPSSPAGDMMKEQEHKMVEEEIPEEKVISDIINYKNEFSVGFEQTSEPRHFQVREYLGEGTNDVSIETVHTANSAHYDTPSNALDIPVPTIKPGDPWSEGDRVCHFWEDLGYAVGWRASGHFNHVHVSWRPGDYSFGNRQDPEENLYSDQLPEGVAQGDC